MKKYKVIYTDCPWEYDGSYNYDKKHSQVPYTTIKSSELMALPVAEIADEDCALFMWATFPKLLDALAVIEAWGFHYTTNAFTWIKTDKIEMTVWSGLGWWTKANAEICLFAKKGHPKRISKSVKQVIFAPHGEHSAKPPQVRDRIVKLMGDVPRIELFARQKVDGWDALGNEIDGRDIRDALRTLCGSQAA